MQRLVSWWSLDEYMRCDFRIERVRRLAHLAFKNRYPSFESWWCICCICKLWDYFVWFHFKKKRVLNEMHAKRKITSAFLLNNHTESIFQYIWFLFTIQIHSCIAMCWWHARCEEMHLKLNIKSETHDTVLYSILYEYTSMKFYCE